MKRLTVEVFLDFIDEVLSKREIEILEDYLDINPDDFKVLEGIQLYYENEKENRDDLEKYLREKSKETDFLFRSNQDSHIFPITDDSNKPITQNESQDSLTSGIGDSIGTTRVLQIFHKITFRESIQSIVCAAATITLLLTTGILTFPSENQGLIFNPQSSFQVENAAEQGEVIAQNNLGNMYKDGVGIDKDYREVIQWYIKAARQGKSHSPVQLSDDVSGWQRHRKGLRRSSQMVHEGSRTRKCCSSIQPSYNVSGWQRRNPRL